jgi:hypothetical protein
MRTHTCLGLDVISINLSRQNTNAWWNFQRSESSNEFTFVMTGWTCVKFRKGRGSESQFLEWDGFMKKLRNVSLPHADGWSYRDLNPINVWLWFTHPIRYELESFWAWKLSKHISCQVVASNFIKTLKILVNSKQTRNAGRNTLIKQCHVCVNLLILKKNSDSSHSPRDCAVK